jgi:hypothetical protein
MRARTRAREAELTPAARIRLALGLGVRDLRIYASARGLDLAEAWRELRRATQVGRTPSAVMTDR